MVGKISQSGFRGETVKITVRVIYWRGKEFWIFQMTIKLNPLISFLSQIWLISGFEVNWLITWYYHKKLSDLSNRKWLIYWATSIARDGRSLQCHLSPGWCHQQIFAIIHGKFKITHQDPVAGGFIAKWVSEKSLQLPHCLAQTDQWQPSPGLEDQWEARVLSGGAPGWGQYLHNVRRDWQPGSQALERGLWSVTRPREEIARARSLFLVIWLTSYSCWWLSNYLV